MFSVHSAFKIHDENKVPFSADAYSRFKYGDHRIAMQFGETLFESFRSAFSETLLSHDNVVLMPSPYGHIPTASYYLAQSFERVGNRFLAENKKRAFAWSKIHRNKTYAADYGALSRDERVNLIQNDTYHIDGELIQGKLVLMIDDVKITGGHEYVIKRQIDKQGIKADFVFIYFAELVNDAIEPSFENVLNYQYVKSIDEVREIVTRSAFRFNTRVIKFILSQEESVFTAFVAEQDTDFREQMIDYAIGNNYHLMAEYSGNLNRLIAESRTLRIA